MKAVAVILLLLFSATAICQITVDKSRSFLTDIESPSIVEYCNQSLWTYSVRQRQIIRLRSSDGKKIQNFQPFKNNPSKYITSISCNGSTLVAAVWNIKTKKNSLISFNDSLNVTPLKLKNLPSFIRQIRCMSNKCLILSDQVYLYQLSGKLTKLNIPATEKIPRFDSVKELNPFSDWQEKHVITREQYYQAVITPQLQLFILDPLRVNVITQPNFNDNNFNPKTLKKWGDWGGWEGHMLFPRGLSYLESFDKILISDTGLKYVFIFSPKGKYWGKLGKNELGIRPIWPMDLSANRDLFYIADYLANKVIGIKIADMGQPPMRTASDIDDLLRKNIFMDDTIFKNFPRDRCLNCHDGLNQYSLHKFNSTSGHHPQQVDLDNLPIIIDAKKAGLPLRGGVVTCSTCHDNHHQSKHPSYLRKTKKDLCLSCHLEKSQKNSNHIQLNSNKTKIKKVDSCQQCHTPHNGQKHLLTKINHQLCFDCHKKSQVPIGHPFGKIKKINVNCTSCHHLHGTLKKYNYAKHSGSKHKSTCLNCHKEFEGRFNSNGHLTFMAHKKKKKMKWPGNEGTCLFCHNPHQKKVKGLQKRCRECHPKIKAFKHKNIGRISKTYVANGISLTNNRPDCTTCHEQHGNQKKYFLKSKNKILRFCLSCHDSNKKYFFDQFHKRGRRKLR